LYGTACSRANNSLARILRCALAMDSPKLDLFKYSNIAIKIAVVKLFNNKIKYIECVHGGRIGRDKAEGLGELTASSKRDRGRKVMPTL
jgi:hypothetical protein